MASDVPLTDRSRYSGGTTRWRSLFGGGHFVSRMLHHRSAACGLAITLALILAAVAGPSLAPYDPIAQNLSSALQPPSVGHLLGTDEFGRDIFSRLLYGARISLTVGVLVVLMSGTIGVTLGMLAGFYEGWLDQLISRAIDILLAFPGILLAIAAVAVLGPSLINALIAVAFSHMPSYARVTRGAVLAQKRREYVEAARSIGARDRRVMFVHLLPNVVAPIVVLASLGVATAILTTASLSFLGLGAQPPQPEWGAMLATGRTYIRRGWWLTFFPGIAIMITVLGINLLGDGLRDLTDPKGERRS